MTLYFFSHIIQSLLFPPGLNLFIAFIGYLLWRRWPVIGKSFVALAFVSLWLLSMPIVASHLINKLQNQYPSLQINNLSVQNNASSIVVLGGGSAEAPEYKNHNMISNVTLSRLQYAVYLHDNTHLPIIVSGGKTGGVMYAEADLMVEVLDKYFKTAAQWKEDKSINTADESRFLMPLFKEHKIDTIYLITNAWHMPRSVYVFRQTGLKVIPAPMGYVMQTSKSSVLNYLPSSYGLDISVIALHEFAGLLWYHWQFSHLKMD